MQEFTRTKTTPQKLAARFVRACAIEMHMDMSQEPFYFRICRKNAGEQMAYPDLTQALWTHCLGNDRKQRLHGSDKLTRNQTRGYSCDV